MRSLFSRRERIDADRCVFFALPMCGFGKTCLEIARAAKDKGFVIDISRSDDFNQGWLSIDVQIKTSNFDGVEDGQWPPASVLHEGSIHRHCHCLTLSQSLDLAVTIRASMVFGTTDFERPSRYSSWSELGPRLNSPYHLNL